jgi:hypothetical protein
VICHQILSVGRRQPIALCSNARFDKAMVCSIVKGVPVNVRGVTSSIGFWKNLQGLLMATEVIRAIRQVERMY